MSTAVTGSRNNGRNTPLRAYSVAPSSSSSSSGGVDVAQEACVFVDEGVVEELMCRSRLDRYCWMSAITRCITAEDGPSTHGVARKSENTDKGRIQLSSTGTAISVSNRALSVEDIVVMSSRLMNLQLPKIAVFSGTHVRIGWLRSLFFNRMLGAGNALLELDLSHCNLRDIGITMLANLLSTSELDIDLEKNQMTPDYLQQQQQQKQEQQQQEPKDSGKTGSFRVSRKKAVSVVVDDSVPGQAKTCAFPVLQKLVVNNNNFSYFGMMLLARTLAGNQTVQEFSANFNYLGDLGGSQMAKALTFNSALKRVSLSRCGFTEAAAQCFLYAVDEKTNRESDPPDERKFSDSSHSKGKNVQSVCFGSMSFSYNARCNLHLQRLVLSGNQGIPAHLRAQLVGVMARRAEGPREGGEGRAQEHTEF